MNKEQAIIETCAIVALAYRSIGDYKYPSDGFCSKCTETLGENWSYYNAGNAIDYVRRAVLNQLKADGYKIAENFDSETGKQKYE